VNGPGEAREVEIGLTGASPNNLIYSNGAPDHKVSNEQMLDELETMIRRRVAAKVEGAKDGVAECTSQTPGGRSAQGRKS
jgi:(E)-4-hydroxy-3-methylbut-2-enyl-diphosphate synthase